MAEGYVQHAPDSTGKKVATQELTRTDDSSVERQELVVGDAKNTESGGLAEVRDQKLQVEDRHLQVLTSIDAKLGELVDLIKLALQGS